MTIQFNNIPGNLRVPLFYAEINPVQAPFQSINRLLLIGQYDTSVGNATAGQAYQINGNEDDLWGRNAMITAMSRIARRNAPFQEIWGMGLADNGAGVAATGTIVVSGPPAADTALSIWIAGVRVQCVAYTTDTASGLAARLKAAIDATEGLPVTASISTATITLTARHKGTCGNTIRIETGLDGLLRGLEDDILTITQLASGSGDPDITSVLANLGEEEFDWIVIPWTDSTNLSAMEAFLNGISGRWSPMLQLYGHCITAKADTLGNLATFGNARNSPHLTTIGCYKSPSPNYLWAAAFGAIAASHLADPPELSRPLHTLPLLGILPPKAMADRPSRQARQSLYYDGVSSYHVRRDGTVAIDRAITMYQLNDWGSPDPSWLDVETLGQATYGIRYLRALATGTYPRAMLMDENPFHIQGAATPDSVRWTLIHGYEELCRLGVFENPEEFRRRIIVERNMVDANRLDVFLPVDHVNQLRIMAVNMASALQYRNV